MAFQNCPGVAQMECFFVWQGQRIENVFHARKATPWSTAELNLLASVMITWLANEWRAVAVSSCSAVGVKCIDLSTELGAVAEPALAEAIAGAMPATNVPTSATVAVGLKTAFRGRSFRGRVYHCGISLSHILDSHLTVAGQIAIQAAYQAIITRMAETAGLLAVLSRRHDKALRPVGLAFDVTSIVVNSSLDSQRRRLPDRGS